MINRRCTSALDRNMIKGCNFPWSRPYQEQMFSYWGFSSMTCDNSQHKTAQCSQPVMPDLRYASAYIARPPAPRETILSTNRHTYHCSQLQHKAMAVSHTVSRLDWLISRCQTNRRTEYLTTRYQTDSRLDCLTSRYRTSRRLYCLTARYQIARLSARQTVWLLDIRQKAG